jgi:hypothetical protein
VFAAAGIARFVAARRARWTRHAGAIAALGAGAALAATGRFATGFVLAALGVVLYLQRREADQRQTATAGAQEAAAAEARRLLGVQADADRAAINAAFRRAALQAHPDQGGDGRTLAALKAARDLLLRRAL